ncbi:ABC transporter permease subunit [Alteromonas facilis]|uniref:ABC transporter permease subunit n=1 Tax=Alteromonas facilis TaxID=2048004 RepID=UPI0013DA33EF|nr:ABC transporter permease subunit [Alteromonas facilis]
MISRQRRRDRIDYFAQRVVVFFGWAVLLTLGVLIWHLLSQALPLFNSPSIKPKSEFHIPVREEALYVGDVKQGGLLVTRTQACALHFYILSVNSTLKLVKSTPYSCNSGLSVSRQGEDLFVVEVSNQNLVRIQQVVNAGSDISIVSILSRAIPESFENVQIHRVELTGRWAVIQFYSDRHDVMLWIDRLSPERAFEQIYNKGDWSVAMPSADASAYVHEDKLLLWPVGADKSLDSVASLQADGLLLATNDPRALYLSKSFGKVSKWTILNNNGVFELRELFSMPLNDSESPLNVSIDPSVNLGMVLTNQARLLLFNRVSGEILFRYQLAEQPSSIAWFGDNLYLHVNDKLSVWSVDDRDSTTTLSTLFEPQRYAGYQEPDYVWQTTNATDYQLAKYSLVPLMIGSIKASMVALLIAIPLALGAAVYTAFFVHPRLRAKIKPAIEMLEAIPSVVIGFIAAVWVAPLAEQFLLALCLFIILLPVVLIAVASTHSAISSRIPEQMRKYWELPLISILVVITACLCLLFAVDLLVGVVSVFQVADEDLQFGTHVNKTTLVVAIALGLAIAPTIYSLAEDAIEGVPYSLKQASFALGATRLQTLRNVVLKVALPGIVAALMLGFGRAFGETMIVLMVTGNTPIVDWDLFTSLRAMTANLAIELPEAEVGSAHYRVLFLTACLLFLFTFVINTLAELLRMRSRKVSQV